MSYKFYVTDWIPELGRYAVITTVQAKVPEQWALEAFVFNLDTEPFFKGTRANYTFDERAIVELKVNEEYMHREALGQARIIINTQKADAYRKTKEKDIVLQDFGPKECKYIFTFLGEVGLKYEDRLKELTKESWSDELAKIIGTFFRTVIRIEPYKSR